MTMLQTALERALPIVAAAFGEQFGVKVVLSGADASTDGKTITLPMLDNMSELKDVLFGYLAHEASHVRDTDFDVLQLCKTKLEKSFLNLIEDIRIEKSIQEVFPGTKFTLTEMENYIFHKGWAPVPKSENNEATQLQLYLYHRLYGEYLNRKCYLPLIPESRAIVESTFPDSFLIRLDGLLAKYMGSLKTTMDAWKISKAILKALEDAEEEERQNQQKAEQKQQSQDSSQDGQGSSRNTSGDGGSDCQPNAGGSDSSSGDSGSNTSNVGSAGDQGPQGNTQGSNQDSSGDQSSQPGSDNQTQGDSQDDGGSGNKADSQYGGLAHRVRNESDLPKDAMDQLKSTFVQEARKDNKGERFAIRASSLGNQAPNNSDKSSLQAGILSSSAIRSKLLGLLQAQNREKQWLNTRGKRVDGKRLSRIAYGDSRVFIKREEHQRPDTAVHVLLDTSISMKYIQDVANQATVSLALAVSSVPKCNIATSMFPGINGDVSPMVNRGQPVRANLGRMVVKSGGGTPLAEAMLHAAKELAASKSQRKVLIIVTDGDPDNGPAVRYINSIITNHLDTYAIGIGSQAVSTYFEKWSVISDVKELQNALFQIAGRFLDLN